MVPRFDIDTIWPIHLATGKTAREIGPVMVPEVRIEYPPWHPLGMPVAAVGGYGLSRKRRKES